ncbi:BapA/Bap/LapF family large adhesin [Pseudomonas sp. KNUC1026]|uniref:BapA/Bap/LapF family large adhesin n=1 Tax=Pseudomonas sp. KNUC1026 TaxID=2893890 RepID=UPI001F4093FB|nr:BapA/Bap/LapF family large adhesin [Pseudomonas sp. KNUC1026]UFH51532.1 Ig-like domain-containing protein [Pseudomonas sp. KNUC1026]
MVLGTATVASNGSFSVNLNAAQLKGQALSVTLTDSAGNVSAGAAVVAPNPNASLPVIATDNLAQAEVALAPVVARQSYSDSFSAALNTSFTQYYTFNIASGTTAHPVLTLTSANAVGLLNGATVSLQVKNAAGAWVTLASGNSSSLLQVSLLTGGAAVQANLATLQAGDYRIALNSTGLNLATSVASQLQLDVTSLTQFTGTPTAVSGNLVTDLGVNGQADSLGPDQSATVSILKGSSYVAAGSGTTVQGLYGTLTIDGAGNYTYTPTGTASSVGKVDTFTYELVHSNGLVSTARLYVRIDSPQATETWSNTNLGANATVVDATNDVASSALTLVPREVVTTSTLGTQSVLVGGSSATYTTSVAAGTTGDLTISLSSANLLSLLGSVQVQLYQQINGSYQLVRTISGSSLVAIGGGAYGVTVQGQVAGNYQIKVTSGGLGVATSLTTTLDQHRNRAWPVRGRQRNGGQR